MSMGGELANGWSLVADKSGDGSAVARGDQRTSSSWRAFKSALLLGAASCIAYPARAQQAPEPVPLPPLNVEATAKKKAAAKKGAAKKAAQTTQVSPAPQPAPTQATQTTAEPGANPYANPDAPYMVEKSASAKLTEPLVNTPRTITAIPKEVIEDKGATDLRELARQTPGVTINAGENGASFGSNLQIRGFNARNDIFVDGIRDPGNIGRDVFAVEQLEIYKGPSGVVAGRATPGGAFNFITKEPDFTGDFYEVTTTVGTDSTFRTTLDANEAFTKDFAARANILYHQNEVAGRDFTEDERWGGLFSVAAKPVDWVTVNLDYYRVRRDAVPDNGVPVSRLDRVPFTELGLDRSNWYGEANLDYLDEESDVGTAKIEAKLAPGVKLTNITRIGTNLQDYLSVAPRPEPNQLSIDGVVRVNRTPNRYQETNLFANQTNLNVKFDTASWRHEVIAGIEFSREEIDRQNNPIAGPANALAVTSIRNPNAYRNMLRRLPRTPLYTAEIDNIGYYIGDTVHLSEQWIVNGGIRFDDFTRDQIGAAPANTARVEENLMSWHTGIVYKPLPIASIYAAYGTSETPIGNELDSTGVEYNGLTAANAHLGPEETRGVEVGTKWELFDSRMLATAAIFESVKDNARTNTPDNTASRGEYRVRGIEVGIAGNITDAWSVFGGAVFLDTEVLDSNVPVEIGRRLANTPLTQFSLFTKYQLTNQLAIGGQAIYQTEVWSGHFAQNNNFYHTTEWWRFDAMAEYEINKHWTVELHGINLTDTLYYDAIYQDPATFAYVAPGRSGYLTVKWTY